MVNAVYQDREGYLWIGTDGGLSRYDGHELTTFTTEDGLSDNKILGIFQDREGYLWVPTRGGLSRYEGSCISSFTQVDGLAGAGDVYSILQDEDGDMWFATYSGVTRYDGETFTTFTTADGLVHDQVFRLLQDRQGNIWFGTMGGGICRYDGNAFTTLTTTDGLIGNNVLSFVEDREGNLWISAGGDDRRGISRYDGETFTTFTTADGLGNDKAWSSFQDWQGSIWFGTQMQGASRYDGEFFTTFTTTNGLAGNDVRSLFQDQGRNIWFGTAGDGVSRYDGRIFTTFTTTDGLTGNWGWAITQTRDGQLWIGDWNGGISRYDGQIFQQLTSGDGLVSDAVRSICQDRDGNIWIGTNRGVTRYRQSAPFPPPIFADAVVADRRYEGIDAVNIPLGAELIAFEFHGISLKTRPRGMVYRYRLEGYDLDWRTTYEPRVEYQGLPMGSYFFEVQAVDRDLVYSENPAIVQVTIHPTYGQMAFVIAFGLALMATVVVSGYALGKRRNQHRAEQALMAELEGELQTAHDMQMGLMPSESPRIQGFDISGRCLPASQVGGDFFQYFSISENRLAISLADVTGHAMEAAVPVMMFSGVLESEIKHGESLADLFASLNDTLHKTLDKRTFVCFTMGELDTDSKKFRLSNGGCPYPYHYKAVSGKISELQVDAYPLGVRAETDYPVIETQLESGDRIVFCSDGIIEAENSEGEIFGFERTSKTIRNGCNLDLSAPQLLDHLISEVKQFTGDTPQGDDQTVVVLAVEV